MSQMQRFLYSYASKPLEGDKKRKEFFPEKGDDAILRRKPICMDRFNDELKNQSDIHAEDYSSCVYHDVEPEAFWEFLYSDEWDDSVILRVFPGELYTDLDRMLYEMLKDHKISRHETCAYLKDSNHNDNIKFEYAPETVRIEFTYYGKNLDRGASNTATFTPHGSLSQTLKDLATISELSFNHKKTTYSKSDKFQKSPEEYDLLSKYDDLMSSSADKQIINISMAHFYCLNSLDIKESIESECDVLEINLRKSLGQEAVADKEVVDRMWRKLKTRLVRRKEIFEDSSEDEDEESEDEEEIGRNGEMKAKGKRKKRKSNVAMDEKKRAELYAALFQSQELLMPAISTEIGLRTIGKILEEEKYLKFDKMSIRTRKKFFLTDTRIITISRKLLKVKPKKGKKTKYKEKLSSSRQKGKCDKMFKRIGDLSNLYEFALVVLGITDSYVLYRLLLCPQYQMGKWKQQFEPPKQPKPIQKKVDPNKNSYLRVLENRIPGSKLKKKKNENTMVVESKQRGDTDKTKYQKRPCSHYNIDKVRKCLLGFAEPTLRQREKRSVSREKGKRKTAKRKVTVQLSDPEKQKYHWEISGDNVQRRLQTEINIPNFSSFNETRIRSERIINVMDNFIVRKERVTSSKGPTFASLAFIRPSFVTKLFQ